QRPAQLVAAQLVAAQRAGHYPTSSATASAWPRPPQIDAAPRPPPRCRSWRARVSTRRAPDAPGGWPIAPAPPLTVWRRSTASSTASSPWPSTRADVSGTHANASLISIASRSPSVQPAEVSAFSRAGAGATAISRGARATLGGEPLGDQDHVAGPGVLARRVGRGDQRAVEDRAQAGQLFRRGVAARALVLLQGRPVRRGERLDLAGVEAGVQRAEVLPVRPQRERVGVLAGDAVLHGDLARVDGHRLAADLGAGLGHRVLKLRPAAADPPADVRRHQERGPPHVVGPAGQDDVRRAAADRPPRQRPP